MGPVAVKGLPDPVEVFALVGACPRTPVQAAATRGLTHFVGRDAELDKLRQALEQARGGQSQVVALVGEPGVGKSRRGLGSARPSPPWSPLLGRA